MELAGALVQEVQASVVAACMCILIGNYGSQLRNHHCTCSDVAAAVGESRARLDAVGEPATPQLRPLFGILGEAHTCDER